MRPRRPTGVRSLATSHGIQHHLVSLARAGSEFTDVVRRISLLAQKNAPLRLSFKQGELTVSAQTPDVGEASESLPVNYEGEPLEIGFNAQFLQDGLDSVHSDELQMNEVGSRACDCAFD